MRCKLSLEIETEVFRLADFEWPHRVDGSPSGMTTIEKPCLIRVNFGTGSFFEITSNVTTLQQEQARLYLISMLPLEKTAIFPVVLEQAIDIAKKISPVAPDIVQHIHGWGESVSMSRPKKKLRYRVEVDKISSLAFELRKHRSTDEWYIVVEVTRLPKAM